jgi:adenosylhomocysteinase
MQKYIVKDIKLSSQGEKNALWAKSQMQALMAVKDRFVKEKPFKNLRIGMALHITKETAMLVETLIAGGAKVAIASCNPLSTQDDIAAYLAKKGVAVFGYKGETTKEYYTYIENVIKTTPDLTIDDGCDLVSIIHSEHKTLLKNIIGGTEETTTGVIRLRAMEKDRALKYPVIAVNDNLTKHLFDNYYGTGQSTFDGILRASNILFAGKTVVVLGYGDCGRGVALRAKGLGSQVIVTEINPLRALQARFDGYEVMLFETAAKIGDVFITVTGNKHVIRKEHFSLMKDGAVLANSGHFNVEIDLDSLQKITKNKKQIRPSLEEYTLKNNKKIYVAAEGRLVNLAAAEGHPATVMSLSFCGQALAAEYLVKNKGNLKNQVYILPEDIDQKIAKLQLDVMGIKIDKLTPEQKKYLNDWQQGT